MPSGDFIGSTRFEVRRRIGSGAFGVVYEAVDGLRNATVAVKALRHATPDALLRFKREFRSLSHIAHPNIVQLYELLLEGDEWLVTMELIRGKSFHDYVWAHGPFRDRGDEPTETALEGSHPTGGFDDGPPPPQRRSLAATPADLSLLRGALPQLAQGLAALHAAGKLHRDIKPSNVLVTAEPRVVLLDFGMVTDTEGERTFDSIRIAGTPAYMSPEQAAGLPLTPASDWYSAGVMLYEVLTGDVPFQGPYLQVLTQKQSVDPPPPSAIVSDVPPELDELCRALLDRNPLARPAGEEILQRLGRPAITVSSSPPPATSPFIGRQKQLRMLRALMQETLQGHQRTVCIAGPSGIGKTSLVRTFLDRVREEQPDAIVLTGRCYQRESVPYKGVDSLIDSLHRSLSRLRSQELEAILPRDILAAEQLFPVLSDLGDAVRARRRISVVPDQQELRRRAFAAMRELFLRLADRAPVVIEIDDLQWGDVDSAELLREILRPPDAPALLFLATYRIDEVRSSPFLRAFLEGDIGERAHEMTVGHLSVEESRQMVSVLLESMPAATSEVAQLIADESGGSPFFIDELVRSLRLADEEAVRAAARLGGKDSDARELNIRDLLRLRLARLDEESNLLLRLIAVNRRPTPASVLREAAPSIDYGGTIARLSSEHLVRARETGSGEEVEIYHDRLADAVGTLIDGEEQRVLHERLAHALEKFKDTDDELLGDHYLAAGFHDRGTKYILRAAEAATRALAFDRAARLYRRAIALDADQAGTVRPKLGDVLASAGRGRDAALEYLAVRSDDFAAGLELKRKAAQQLLFSGHVDEGLAVVRTLLGAIGVPYPETRRDTILALLRARLKLKLRGLRFRERPAGEIAAHELLRVDTCRSVALGLSSVDTIRGAVFQTRYLLLALAAGDPHRVAHSLAMECGYSSVGGTRTSRRTHRLTTEMRRIASCINAPFLHAFADLAEGIAAALEGRFRAGAELLFRAETELLEHSTGVAWELGTARAFGLRCHQFLGDIRVMTDRFPGLLRDAQERGDRYFATNIVLFSHYVHLAADRPRHTADQIEDAIHGWSQAGFHVQHMWHLKAGVEIALYEGQGLLAWTKIAQSWRAARGSLVARVQFTRIVMEELRGRAALAAARDTPAPRERERLLTIAAQAARRVEKEKTDWGVVLSQLLRSGIASVRGRESEAIARLRKVETLGREQEMRLHIAAAQRCLAQLLGGEEGAALNDESTAWMTAEGIRNHESMMRTIVPWIA